MMHVLHVVGARPNFMKAAPVIRALSLHKRIRQTLAHTGQHYDFSMSGVFFQELGIPVADVNLQIGRGSHAQQTAAILTRFEPVIEKYRPDLVLVYGDVNSTMAAALVCSKVGVPVGHVEAGLRSFDRTMPEEINRVLTDQISDLLFTPSEDANVNLSREGIALEKLYFVGNVMIDTLVQMLPQVCDHLPNDLPKRYVLVTFHRPSNVDDFHILTAMFRTLYEVSSKVPILFPIHPRTKQRLLELGLNAGMHDGFKLLEPLPYLEFLALQTRASVVITDSGGIQEETTFLDIPCLTMRENTERPVTVQLGTNILVGRDPHRLRELLEQVLAGNGKKRLMVPPLWDGSAADRIAAIVAGSRLEDRSTSESSESRVSECPR